MRRLGIGWLVLAALLFALAAYLATGDGDGDGPHHARRTVRFPRVASQEDVQRATSRRSQVVIVHESEQPTADERAEGAEPLRDPVLRVLPAEGEPLAVVVELNALKHSQLGELFVSCLSEHALGEQEGELDELLNRAEDIDRVAFGNDFVAISGFFGKESWRRELGVTEGEPYGEHGVLLPERDGEAPNAALWHDELLIIANRSEPVLGAIDRLEGRAAAQSPIGEEEAFGELYGTLPPSLLAKLLPAEQAQLKENIMRAVDAVQLHATAMDDVAMRATFVGHDPQALRDVAKGLGGALSLLRLAALDSDDQLAELLDFARVSPAGEAFDVELALPADYLSRHLQALCTSMATP